MTKSNTARDEAPLLTIAEVARLDSCSQKTVRRAIDAGLLSVVRIGPSGRALRITKEAHALYRLRVTGRASSPLKPL